MKFSIITLFIFSFLSFTILENTPAFKVEHKGALKSIMHEGDISAKAHLSELKNDEHVYALGAVENLKGEILILDSKPFVTSVENNELSIDQSFDKNACLLVYAHVAQWNNYDVPNTISSYEDFEEYVEQVAREKGINTEEPFPFLLEGSAKKFDWHVINWKDGDTEHSHEKHIHSGLNGTLTDTDVEILGFYSKHHHTIFTHHSTNMHLHVKTKDNKIAGHVDGLTLGEKMLLKLPKVN